MKKEEMRVSGIKEGNISLILESYDDIFSSFDPRPSSERALSDDFLVECKRASIDREEPITLRFLVPHSKRNLKEELEIQFRLKNHFHKHYLEKRREINRLKIRGIFFIFIGLSLMFISYLTYSGFLFSDEILKNILLVITEPIGWFFFWIGGEKFVYRVSEINPGYTFYKKMDSSRVLFLSY
jgi:hypothetical protein